MPNRFDIFISRLETKSAREGASLHAAGNQPRPGRDEGDTKPVRSAQALAQKDHAKNRNQHDA